MKTHAILAAAGSGKRFVRPNSPFKGGKRNALPKQFQKLHNKPIILYSLLALQKCKQVNSIVISADRKYFNLIDKLIPGNKITKFHHFAKGGKTRFESVRNAFVSLDADKNDLVLIHDAARPMIKEKDLDRILSEAKKRRLDGVIYGRRITDTIKKVRRGTSPQAWSSTIEKTVNRENLWTAQTPQVFKYGILKNAYKKNASKKYTDESALVEAGGYKVKILEGKPENVKITTHGDFLFAAKR